MERKTRRRTRYLAEMESEDPSYTESEEKVKRKKQKRRGGKTRNESSLSVLTTKFLELLN